MCGNTLFAELRGRDTWELPRILRLFWKPPKIRTKITPSEKYLPNIPTQKVFGNQNFQTQKFPLIIAVTWVGVPPPPPVCFLYILVD